MRFNIKSTFPKINIVKNPKLPKKSKAVKLSPSLKKIERNMSHDSEFLKEQYRFIRENDRYSKKTFNANLRKYRSNYPDFEIDDSKEGNLYDDVIEYYNKRNKNETENVKYNIGDLAQNITDLTIEFNGISADFKAIKSDSGIEKVRKIVTHYGDAIKLYDDIQEDIKYFLRERKNKQS